MAESAQKSNIRSEAAGGRHGRRQARQLVNEPKTSSAHSLQTRAGNRALSALLGDGQPLSDDVRSDMEARFGSDFATVRVHSDDRASKSATSMHAKAFTYGDAIVFNSGRYAPHDAAGKRLLAHELAHVIQQRRGGSPPPLREGAPHEAAADHAADGVVGAQAPVTVHGATGVGVAREAEEAGSGLMAVLVERAKRSLIDRITNPLGLPLGGVRLASAAATGMTQQILHELISESSGGEGKAAILLGHLASIGPKDGEQLVKGYFVGLLEGVASPVTDLFGLGVLAERLENAGVDLLFAAFSSHADISKEWQAIVQRAGSVKASARESWDGLKRDPGGTIVALLGLPDAVSGMAEKKAYELGKLGGSAIISSLLAPFDKKEKGDEKQPDPSRSPLAWIESNAKDAENRILDTPWSMIGSKVGYSVGFVAIQVILFAFTDGAGNAIEEVGAALGRMGEALGKLSKTIGAVAGRVAEVVSMIGKGIAAVEEALGVLTGKLLKPLEKILKPVTEPLVALLGDLRVFLRKLFGVVEKDGAQLAEAAAAKSSALADDASRTGSKLTPSTPATPEPHAPPPTKPKPGTNVSKPPSEPSLERRPATPRTGTETGEPNAPPHSASKAPATKEPDAAPKAVPEKAGGPTAAEKPPAKPAKARTGKKSGSGNEPAKADAAKNANQPTTKPPPKKASAKPDAVGQKAAGGKAPASKSPRKQAALETPGAGVRPKRTQPRINDPHGMRPDATNFDRQTAGAGGIDEISFLRDPDGRYAVKIKGKLKDSLYRGKGKPPVGKTKAPNYNRSRKFVSNRQAGLDSNWENAHLWGPGFGDEAAAGMMKAPRAVNQWYQNEGIEGWARDLRKAADELAKVGGKAAEVEIEATALAWDLHGNSWQPKTQVDFLKRAEYRVKLTTPQGQKATVTVTIDVPRPPAHGAVLSFDPPHAFNPADLLNIVKGRP